MQWIIDIFNWCKANLEILKWIGLGIVCLVLSPFLIAIIKAIFNGIISILRFIWSIIISPYVFFKKIDNILKRRKYAKMSNEGMYIQYPNEH